MDNSAQNALTLLSVALNKPPDSDEQADVLHQLLETLEANPSFIPILYSTLTSMVNTGGNQMKRWIVGLMELAICRSNASFDARTQIVLQSLDPLLRLLVDPDVRVKRTAIACFATAYPLLFKYACGTSTDQKMWEKVVAGKALIFQYWRSSEIKFKLPAIKGLQRIIQSQTRASTDPRLHRTDPNLANCPSHHPFLKGSVLEDEANKLLEECITALFTSSTSDVVSAIINMFVPLLRLRPALANLVVTSLINWTPANLAGCSFTQTKSVEKTLRIAVTNILRSGQVNSQVMEMSQFLSRQATRMEEAAAEAKTSRDEEASRKRQMITEEISLANKRRKVEVVGTTSTSPSIFSTASSSSGFASDDVASALAAFDVSSLPVNMVVELIIANFQVVTEDKLQGAIESIRQQLGASPEQDDIRQVDPLQYELEDEDEIQFKKEEDKPGQHDAPIEIEEDLIPAEGGAEDIKLPLPEPLSRGSKSAMGDLVMGKIWDGLKSGGGSTKGQHYPQLRALLAARLVSRAVPPSETELLPPGLREKAFEFIENVQPQSKLEIATNWLNDEWYATLLEGSRDSPQYALWLHRLMYKNWQEPYQKTSDLVPILIDLPAIPREEIERVGLMCAKPERMQAAYACLRELAILRPPVRKSAMDVLFSLTVHPDKVTRNAAIITVKRFVPDMPSLAQETIGFALSLLSRLSRPPADTTMHSAEEEEKSEPGETKPPIPIKVVDGEVVEGLSYPETEPQLLEHIELLLSLTPKQPDLLSRLFEAYSTMTDFCKSALPPLISPLIKSLGARHPKILEMIRSCPSGSEELALAILNTLVEKGRPAPSLVAAIRDMANETEVDARFLIPVIGELDQADINRHLPRVISLLDGTPERKALVRSVFDTVVVAPPQAFGTASTNVPRTRQPDLLTPRDLLVMLHQNEQDIGRKAAIEAIGICFSMTDIFRPEILAAFMQHVVDEPSQVPTLFLRTVIQAVTTYKSLQPFVSTTLLSRLITKKIWTSPQLWEGFIRCAKTIAPHSFGALLQLPREQLKEVVGKNPTLRQPLHDYVVAKAGRNQGRITSLLEVLAPTSSSGEEGGGGGEQSPDQAQIQMQQAQAQMQAQAQAQGQVPMHAQFQQVQEQTHLQD